MLWISCKRLKENRYRPSFKIKRSVISLQRILQLLAHTLISETVFLRYKSSISKAPSGWVSHRTVGISVGLQEVKDLNLERSESLNQVDLLRILNWVPRGFIQFVPGRFVFTYYLGILQSFVTYIGTYLILFYITVVQVYLFSSYQLPPTYL